jgi:hypothetical protein
MMLKGYANGQKPATHESGGGVSFIGEGPEEATRGCE